jgi:hypothetical protein
MDRVFRFLLILLAILVSLKSGVGFSESDVNFYDPITEKQSGSDQIGLEVYLETGAEDLLTDGWFYYIFPGLQYDILDSGVICGIEWQIPLAPEPEVGVVTILARYEHESERVPITIFTGTELDIEPKINELEGFVYAGAGFFELFSTGLEFYYVPETILKSIYTLGYEFDINTSGLLGMEAEVSVILYEARGVEDITFDFYYSHYFERFILTTGVEPQILIAAAQDGADFAFTPYVVCTFEF